ncbi:SIMPL domain-containing protein [Bdellovibrio sp. 22V]|uniref:SIMPL domain-containing protein n=1 Tax=Bdellovibrio TaxID=958 RepID=UPI002543D0C5|nr:SIMPL domain-containing protein [Bdellovibrio sp. 22V]WII72270.1 SIMPL domain-containing protein [Bdellovibrio sp. 22V]
MKRILGSVLVAISLLASGAHAEDKLIVVNGVAEKSLDPNMVHLNVEVWSKAATAKQAQQLAANQFKAVKKSFDDFKIKKEDIQTENYALNPEYEYEQKTGRNKMIGFRVSQSLVVTLRKVEDAGAFLDSLVTEKKAMDSGVNVNNLTWDSDKRNQVETAALGDAVRAAKMKAEEIAKAAGVKVKGVSRISHMTSNNNPPSPVFRNFGMKSAVMEAASTDVAPGQIKVRVEVTAEYDIN